MILDEDGRQRADSPVGDGVWWAAGYPSVIAPRSAKARILHGFRKRSPVTFLPRPHAGSGFWC